MTVLRPRAIAVALFVFVFAVNIQSAFATHFRFGTMSWEKNLAAGTATTDTYIVTAEVSMRWSYPYGTPGFNSCPNIAGWVPSPGAGTMGVGSCAPVGTVVNLGTINLNKASLVNGVNTISTTFNAQITSVSPSTDTMYARMIFTVVVLKVNNPVLIAHQNNARISTLLEGNADQNYRLETTLDYTKGTRSPRSVSLPVLNVTTGILNEIFIPTVAFDNFVNKLSFATSAQSLLVRTIPGSSTAAPTDDMTIDPSSTLVRWTPVTSGLYAVQFRITSYDHLGVEKASVPLDLLINAKPPSPTDPAVSLTTPLTTVIFPVGATTAFDLTSILTPATAGYFGVLNNTPLPNGAVITSPACTGNQACVRTVIWSPNIQSTSSVVCFQSQYSNGVVTVQSPGMLCVNMLVGAFPTTTTAFAANGVAGGPVTLRARVLRAADGSPVIQQNVVFSWADTGEVLGTGVTDVTGLAQISPIIVEPAPSGRAYQAVFQAVANQFLASSATSNASVVTGATATPDMPVITPLASVGIPVAATVHLNRQLVPNDGGIHGVLQPVQVTVTAPGGTSAVGTGTTDMSGNATVEIPITPQVVGSGWSAFARFEGSTSLAGNTQSPTVNFNVYQRVKLTLTAPAQAARGVPTTVLATLQNFPQGNPLSGRQITLSTAGITSQTVATNGMGQALFNLTFPANTPLGAVNITSGTVLNGTTEVNSDGFATGNETDTATMTLVAAQPSTIAAQLAGGIAGAPVTLRATLTGGGGPIRNVPVTFSIVGGAQIGVVDTDEDGVATIDFMPASAISGAYRADFAGGNGYVASFAQAALTVNKAATSLAPLTIADVEFVGNSLPVSTALSRVDAPAGAVPGATVQFAMTAPSGAVATLNATTDSNGAVSVMFPLTERGQHHVTATYAGNASLAPASRSGDLGIFQKTQLIANAAHGVATDATSVGAGLFALPGNAPIPGATVSLDFQGVVASGDAVTGAAGIATIARTFVAPGSYQYTASFSDFANYFVNENGDPVPTMASSTVQITDVATSLAPIQVSSAMPFVGDDLVVKTVLSRVTDPAGAIAGQQVTFNLTTSSGAVVTQVATTNANGEAQATFPLSARGIHTIAAEYSGNTALRPASVSSPVTTHQKVRIVMAPIGSAVAGLPVNASAALVAIPQNTPIAAGQITFTTTVAGVGPATTVVDGSGVASTEFVFPFASTVGVIATHVHPPAEFFANSVGQLTGDTDAITNASVPVTGAPAAFSPIVIAQTGLVGNSTAASATLSRADNNAPMAGRAVTFTFTSPGNVVSQVAGQTDATGAVSVAFTPTERGIHSVTATFAGDGAVFPAASAPATITVYQRVAITLSAPAGAIAGQDIALTATLKTVPGNAGIAAQSVNFTSNFSAASTAITDANGIATVTISAASAGTLNAQATFLNIAGFFVNDAGDLVASSAAATSDVSAAATALSNVIVPAAALVDGAATVSTVLTRTSAPAGAAAGETVHFTITDPNGSTIQSGTALTSAAGVASFNFTPVMRGVHTVTASFGGSASLLPTGSNTATMPAYQRTKVTIAGPASVASGASFTLTGTLTTLDGSPLAGRPMIFATWGTSAPQQATAVTNAQGIASMSFTAPEPGSFTATASFVDTNDHFANRNGELLEEFDSTAFDVTAAATSLSAVTGPSMVTELGNAAFTATLTRNDGLAIAPGLEVRFVVTEPGGSTLEGVALTDASGAATINFAQVLTKRGAHSITASFEGDAVLLGASAAAANFNLYHPTLLQLSSPNDGVAGAPITFEARLTALGIEQPGQTIEFNFGSAAAPATATTDANGIAAVQVRFAAAGNVVAQASFFNAAEFFTNRTAALPPASEVVTAVLNITAAATSLTNVTTATGALVAEPTTMSATLARPDGIAIAAGTPLTFTITTPDGGTQEIGGSTDVNGLGIVSFAPTMKGLHNVTVSFPANEALQAAVSPTAAFPVYQRTQLVLPPAAGSATKDTTVSAVLTAEPGGAPLAGESVTFSFNGPGAPADVTGTTDANGVVSVTVTFPSVANYTSNAQWFRDGGFYTSRDGNIPPTATMAVGLVDVTNNAPTFTPPANITVEATSPGGAPVTFTASGADIEDGPLVADCQASSGFTFPLGTTTVSCSVTDSAGATAGGTFTITVQDTTAPALTVPASIVTDATSPAGATVSFTVTAFDTVSLAVAPVCAPASGSLFTVGTTTVNCTATDAVSNQSSGSFTITIRSTQQMTANLQQAAAAAGMSQGDNNLDNLAKFLNGQGTTNAACNNLSSFIKKAQKLPASQAGPVIAAAMNLWASVPCSGTP